MHITGYKVQGVLVRTRTKYWHAMRVWNLVEWVLWVQIDGYEGTFDFLNLLKMVHYWILQ